MGACLCKGHQDLHRTQQLAMGELQSMAEGRPIVKDSHQPYNDIMSDKKSNSRYDIGELATSSLLGLVATIKEHITKPTAMAQGRVAHLIEWKGWGGETAVGGGWCGWNKDGGGWEGVGAALQEDQQLYSHLADEIKEARFAAGVAEQFALAEAAMNMWSAQEDTDQPTTSSAPLEDPENLFLSQFLVDGGSVGVPQHLYSIHMEANKDSSSLGQGQPQAPASNSQPEPQCLSQEGVACSAHVPVQHADSSSLSEDEVFYN
ncbi:protein FAM131C [Chanos chanos]|uniref:Protein FAM131C n=1 Tax=Chanos chanos TaxID=29144 RepID=A0A6J2V4D3_CHACN|nr:protein FAM131C [Chanos chanos]